MKRSSVKKMSVMSGLLLFFLPFALNINAKEYKKPGLLIISHGSSNQEANNKVETMVEEMRKENNDKNYFHAIENAFLEVGAPTVKTGVERLQKAGCDMIVAVPFFTSQDGHTQEDIPVVLGLSSDPEILAELKEEGIELANPKLPVVITKTLNETKLLRNFAKSEVDSMSLKGKEETLVLVSLEKNDYKDIVTPKIAEAAKYAANAKGIKKLQRYLFLAG
ncbi:Cobalamin (vitamin B12) biosynthesis CbiX protein [Elusimicrobium minutum Pei191]|uniref:Cobalamin (Vitamin B12) biosynthesis CbiX protein n=1 Tax=Elusimicrobium minutum (strain Pei191) TaxID=445932 RepID=B2KD42_ELUMP|nr:CbiX/SirB N-terminal domain-containing protein [Elusimicrobium minutum]ACC98438.1 Cobalamin (vitamin B12) biosynthesis CbiX protein [Elusimicrobium minutum Pei191]